MVAARQGQCHTLLGGSSIVNQPGHAVDINDSFSVWHYFRLRAFPNLSMVNFTVRTLWHEVVSLHDPSFK